METYSTYTDITLDIAKHDNYDYIYAKQYDSSTRFIRISLTENDEPYTILPETIARFRCTKPDNRYVINSEDDTNSNISINNNQIIIELSSQVLALHGTIRADVGLYQYTTNDNNERINKQISSCLFYINVEQAGYDDEALRSSNEFGALETVLAQANYFREQIERCEEATDDSISTTNTCVDITNECIAETEKTINATQNCIEQTGLCVDATTQSIETTNTIQHKADNGDFDGKSLEYDWEGTSLGIRVEGNPNYEYTNLKGDTGNVGARGFSPTVNEDKNNTNNIYKLNIVNEDGVFTTPNLKGQNGTGDMSTSIYDPNNKGYDIFSHDIKDDVVSFVQALTRANISTGESVDVILGKISKVIADLNSIAFTGAVSDLSGIIPLTKGGTGASTASAARANLGIVNLTIFSTTSPSDTTALWLDKSLSKPTLKFYNGSSWIPITSDGGLYRGTSTPTDTNVLWINTSTGIAKYHNGSAWVNITSTWG
ncbi:BppU family phage baseplate upper protein [Anaerosporobacter sp.]|uniref:BppU family phage baseplate upper protein n=1 Tax=Anaerosporobacter sp. TaxID=1872529 RepID=UPI00286F7CE9|nr:BppU family phage baseplate upper protein [Anaerosporobacter sp.]